ncbi:gliding motility-associated C-terminal domain-containing protein [Ekhidna sp.]|uniref:gliding motility-associated C-terminal domain-containing protein n=1 Tax=Ekhidna sp. TaxID=2608089 RepID=UPI003B510382
MHRWTPIIFVLLFPMLLSAQVLSSKGRFSVEFDKGCAPMTVNITELDTFGDVTRQYYYFEGADITNNQTFSYQDPGVYQIVQVVGVDGIDDKTDTLFVEALTSLKPQVLYSKCNGRQISVTSADTYYDSIRVYFTLNDSVTLINGQTGSFTFSTNDSQVVALKGLFQNADEICSTFFDNIAPIPVLESPEIVNASVKETCKDLFTLYLELDSIDSLINYRINLIQPSPILLFDGYLSESTIVLNDIPFNRQNYCVNIEAYDPCNDTSDFSENFCAESNDLSLSPFESMYSIYTGSGIYINLDEVGSGSFKIFRRLDQGEFEERSNQTGSFTDPVGSKARRYYYQIDYVDSCNQILYSAETNPPLVEVDNVNTNTFNVSFIPPNNSIQELGVNEYHTGNDFSKTSGEITQSNFTVQLDAKDGSPRQFVSASTTYASNGITLNSNAVTVRHELVVYVPTAFTPNGDGLNDTLELFGLPTEIATTKIYSRWGQLIYSSDQASPGWDGTIGGSAANEGTYLYEITFETSSGEIRTQKGTFALIKK